MGERPWNIAADNVTPAEAREMLEARMPSLERTADDARRADELIARYGAVARTTEAAAIKRGRRARRWASDVASTYVGRYVAARRLQRAESWRVWLRDVAEVSEWPGPVWPLPERLS